MTLLQRDVASDTDYPLWTHWRSRGPLGHGVEGILALSGVIVNDSLVLVDAVNKQQKAGISLQEAVLNADVIRFRRTL